MKRPVLFCALLLGLAARADEGMWTYNNFPSKKVQQKYGFAPDAPVARRVRSSARCGWRAAARAASSRRTAW